MFSFFGRGKNRSNKHRATQKPRLTSRPSFHFEGLEDRRLLSASLSHASSTPTTSSSAITASATSDSTTATNTKINFSDAPAAVQTGLTALAQGVTIGASQSIRVKTFGDVTTYSTAVAVNGKLSRISVDADGNALQGKLAFSETPSVVQVGLQAQVSGVTLSDSQIVTVRSRPGGVTVYSTSVTISGKAKTVATDADGTAVTRSGRELDGGTTTTYADASDTVKAGLAKLAQGTTIADDQVIEVLTLPNDVTFYSAVLVINGETTRVAVDADGNVMEGSVAFSDTPAAVQTGLQSQATDGTIPASQLVQIHSRPGGETTYTVYSTAVTVDGQPTVIAVDGDGATVSSGPGIGGPDDGGGHGGPGGGGPEGDGGPGGGGPGGGGPGGGHDHGPGADGGTDSSIDRTTVDFSTTPSAVQSGLQKLAGDTTLASDQQVMVVTDGDGNTTYSVMLKSDTSWWVRLTVDASGTALEGQITFANAPSAVQTGLQKLAGDTTVADDAVVQIHTDRNGTTVYSTRVTVDGTATVIAVDSTGAEVALPPHDGMPGGGHGPHGDPSGSDDTTGAGSSGSDSTTTSTANTVTPLSITASTSGSPTTTAGGSTSSGSASTSSGTGSTSGTSSGGTSADGTASTTPPEQGGPRRGRPGGPGGPGGGGPGGGGSGGPGGGAGTVSPSAAGTGSADGSGSTTSAGMSGGCANHGDTTTDDGSIIVDPATTIGGSGFTGSAGSTSSSGSTGDVPSVLYV